MTITTDEKSPDRSGNSSQGSGTYLGAEATNKTTATLACCTDELGLPKAACWDMALDQHRRGYLQGYADGARRVEHDVDQSVRRVIRDLDSWGWGGL